LPVVNDAAERLALGRGSFAVEVASNGYQQAIAAGIPCLGIGLSIFPFGKGSDRPAFGARRQASREPLPCRCRYRARAVRPCSSHALTAAFAADHAIVDEKAARIAIAETAAD
jgi:hypothetical protein